jgi:hypothetical protein
MTMDGKKKVTGTFFDDRFAKKIAALEEHFV